MTRLQNLDWCKWGKNTALFFAPVALIYLFFVQANLGDGFTVEDFVPSQTVIGSMVLYLINVIIDFIKKFVSAGE